MQVLAEPDEIEKAVTTIISRPQGIEERRFVGELIIRGHSPALIDLKFYDQFGRRLERPWLDKLCRRVKNSGKLRLIQERREAEILATGLARKAERVQRLSDYVDAIEPAALLRPDKIGIEYRRGIDQIKQEVEGLGIDVTIHPADAWGELLNKIAKLGEARENLEQANAEAGADDS